MPKKSTQPKPVLLASLTSENLPRDLITARRARKNFDITTRTLKNFCTAFVLPPDPQGHYHADKRGEPHRRYNRRWSAREIIAKMQSGEVKPERYAMLIV